MNFFSCLRPHPLAMEGLLLRSAKVPAVNGQQVNQMSMAAERNKGPLSSDISVSLQDTDIVESDYSSLILHWKWAAPRYDL